MIGAFYDVYNALGFGFLEGVYRRGLAADLRRAGVPFEQEVAFPVHYRGDKVGTYRCDLLVDRRVIVEVKATHKLTDADPRQVLNYLRASGCEVGLLLHFGPTASFKRIVASPARFDPRHPR